MEHSKRKSYFSHYVESPQRGSRSDKSSNGKHGRRGLQQDKLYSQAASPSQKPVASRNPQPHSAVRYAARGKSEEDPLEYIFTSQPGSIKRLSACSHYICREVLTALKDEKPREAWLALFRLKLSLEEKSLPKVADELTYRVIDKILEVYYQPSRAHHDDTAMTELFLIQILPAVLLQHHFKNDLEKKYHFVGGILLKEKIDEIQDKSRTLQKNTISPQGQALCDQLVEIMSLWRPVLSQARLDGIAITLARVLAPVREEIFNLAVKENKYQEALDKLKNILPVMDIFDNCNERGVITFRSGCLIGLNHTLHGLADELKKNNPSIHLAVHLLRSVQNSQNLKWQEAKSCQGQIKFLLEHWPEVRGFPASGLTVYVQELQSGPTGSAWDKLYRAENPNNRYIFHNEINTISFLFKQRDEGHAISCLIVTSQLLKKFPDHLNSNLCQTCFDIFDASLETVAAALLLDTRLYTPDKQTHIADVTAWLFRILEDWSSDALMLSQKSRWTLERLRYVLYENKISPMLDKAKKAASPEPKLKEFLRTHSNYGVIFPSIANRTFMAEIMQLYSECDVTKLAMLLPPQSDRVVCDLFGEQIADQIRSFKRSSQETDSVHDSHTKKTGIIKSYPTHEASIQGHKKAEEPKLTDKLPVPCGPVKVLKPSANIKVNEKTKKLISQGQLLEAATLLLEPESFQIVTEDDFKKYQKLVEEIIFPALIHTSRIARSDYHVLLHKCLELARKASLSERENQLTTLIAKQKQTEGEALTASNHKDDSVKSRGRGTSRGRGRGRGRGASRGRGRGRGRASGSPS